MNIYLQDYLNYETSLVDVINDRKSLIFKLKLFKNYSFEFLFRYIEVYKK